ncbi:MAG TPA: oligoendopeptidase F [Chloroflexi bacterium]|nr:oligoendopeptidase F [Chloroflexota bacterium]
MSKNTTLPPRSEVPVEETWNLESIFVSVEDWEAALKEVESLLPEAAIYQGKLAEGPEMLLKCLEYVEKIYRLGSQAMVYGMLGSSVDTADQAALARGGQSRALMNRVGAAVSYVEPEMLGIGFDKLKAWVAREPRLAVYAHYIDSLEHEQAHVRSSEVEEALALAGDPLSLSFSAYGAITNADLKFKPAKASDGSKLDVGQSSISALVTHADRKVRRTGWQNYADGYLDYKNTLAAIQTGGFQRDVFNMRARRYASSLEASLYPNNVPNEVFYNLIEVFKKNLPTWHKYWRVRRKALGYKKLHPYDVKAPLTQNKVEVPYAQAVKWICEGMAPLGEEYVKILRQGCTTNRWVDRALNKGKRQGAFSGGAYDTQPFIMMSYSDDLFSLSTLAHELGHSMHSYYTRTQQPFIYGRYSLFVAEVASNFNQAMVRDYLFKTQTDPDFQMGLIEEAMSNFHRYFFIMPTLARWELEMHERVEKGAPVNAQIFTNRCAELFAEGYGDEVADDHDRTGITWAQFGHMYMNFYVYQYATGISGAHALVDRVLAEGPAAAEDYRNFLRAGGSVYPLEALKSAGVDLTNPEPVEKAFGVLADIVNRLEELVG